MQDIATTGTLPLSSRHFWVCIGVQLSELSHASHVYLSHHTVTRKCRTSCGRAWASWYRNTTVCCSMSMVSKTSRSQSSAVLTKYRWSYILTNCNHFSITHMLGLNFTPKSWAESLPLMSVDYACTALTRSDLNYCHGPQMPSVPSTWVVWRCVMAVVLHCSSHWLSYWVDELDFCNIKTFKHAHLKFPESGQSKGTSIHTRVHNAATLVWGPLRLTTIKCNRLPSSSVAIAWEQYSQPSPIFHA